MSESLYEHKRGPKRLLLIEEAVHANAYAVNPQRYTEEVHALIQETLGSLEEPWEVSAPLDAEQQAYLPSI
ncbi:hypothetical protein D3C75_1132110 [compost metagenome]